MLSPETKGPSLRIPFWLGLIFFVLVLLAPLPEGMTPAGKKVLAAAFLMATWWIGEALPIPCTALVPLALFPLMGVMKAGDVAPNYGNENIFLFMGGLFMAMAMQKWNLHRRMALAIVGLSGQKPGYLIMGFMLATGLISMWISDTATVMMMMPIGVAVIMHFEEHQKLPEQKQKDFAAAMMLGIAYAGVIGGIGTLIGTPPNLVFAGTVAKLVPDAPEIGFAKWMMVGGTVTITFLPLVWVYLTRIAFQIPLGDVDEGTDRQDMVKSQLAQLGPMKKGEKITLAVFLSAALLWLTRGEYRGDEVLAPGWALLFPNPDMIHDSTVAMLAALALFVMTVDGDRREYVLDWEWARRIPWRVLLLFGGGFALAHAFQVTELADWIGRRIAFLEGLPAPLMVAVVCFLMTFLTEVTSNTATTTVMMPVLATAGHTMGIDPLLLMMPAAMSASCAFMLPVATPGNAIVFGSGYLTIPQMAKAGFWLNLVGVILITLVTILVGVPVFGLRY
ncbi:MAG: DASS family sodium-coupled anion symporter [Vulcanimicrobiota bacterium]